MVCFVSSASAGDVTPACQKISEDFKKSPFYETSPLGIAGNFHLVGFSSVTTTAHTNGNILTDTLYYRSNFGTKGVAEVSYIRKIEFPPSGDGFSSTNSSPDSLLVVGTEVRVGTTDNGNAWTLNGRKVDAPMLSHNRASLMQDSDDLKYIDLQAVYDQTVHINQTLRTYEDRQVKVIQKTEGNRTFIQKVILSDPAGVNVYNINITDAHAFKEGDSIACEGFDKHKPGLLILNVDLKGANEFLLPGTDIFYEGGGQAPNWEVTDWQPGNVLWNLYDSSAKDGLYRGQVRNARAVAAHILAPEADVTLGVNLNGTVIAKSIDVKAESHRTDLTMMFSVDPGGNTLDIPVWKDWWSDKTFEVEAVLIRSTDAQGGPTECASLRLNESNGWRGTFEEVEKSDADGNEYVYQVKERVGSDMYDNGDSLVHGEETYIVSIQATPESGFWITNALQGGTPSVQSVSVSVKKRWDLRAAGLVPYPVTVRLYQNGVGIAERTLTPEEGVWSGSFENLPAENANGQPYKYTIKEIINGHSYVDGDEFAYGETHTGIEITGDQQNGYIITNTLWKAGLVAVPVYKTWDLGAGMNKYPVTFELYRHVLEEDASRAVRVENPVCDYSGPYQVEFRDLPKYDEYGRSYVYTVREAVGGKSYTNGDVFASPGGGKTAVSIVPAESGGFVVRNVVRSDGELLDVPVRKEWRGSVSTSAAVQLYRAAEGGPAEKMEGCVLLLGEHNGWKGVFENLQRHDAAGHAYTYTVREIVEGASYKDGDRFVAGGALIRLSIEGNQASGFTVINTVESTKGPPVTGVASPVAPSGAGLLVSVAGMSAAWLVIRRRKRKR